MRRQPVSSRRHKLSHSDRWIWLALGSTRILNTDSDVLLEAFIKRNHGGSVYDKCFVQQSPSFFRKHLQGPHQRSRPVRPTAHYRMGLFPHTSGSDQPPEYSTFGHHVLVGAKTQTAVPSLYKLTCTVDLAPCLDYLYTGCCNLALGFGSRTSMKGIQLH